MRRSPHLRDSSCEVGDEPADYQEPEQPKTYDRNDQLRHNPEHLTAKGTHSNMLNGASARRCCEADL
jgi:hypothetical protein